MKSSFVVRNKVLIFVRKLYLKRPALLCYEYECDFILSY